MEEIHIKWCLSEVFKRNSRSKLVNPTHHRQTIVSNSSSKVHLKCIYLFSSLASYFFMYLFPLAFKCLEARKVLWEQEIHKVLSSFSST